ncbi:glutaredoxin family protein [Alkalihalobacterium bogoriense]|uniref:glutaredoxin family protein n=1 Tax=Alkalihalobacterium bogoriense TaxID=246272 RepID=UPI000A86DF55|nr:glutaredoxin family protein [Alkalihalobacterium bogoriense]
MKKIKMTFYSKENCSLCDKGFSVLQQLTEEFPLDIHVVDIYKNEDLLEKYQIMIPVVVIDGEDVDFGILSKNKIRKRLLEKKG